MWLGIHRPAYLQSLQPGASETALERFESRFNLTLPEAFKTLYRWRNGQNPRNSSSLYGNHMFSALEEITDTKDMLDGMIGTDFDDPAWWQLHWVPFLSNGSGDHLCADTRTGQLIAFWHDWDNRSVEFPSVNLWLESIVQRSERNDLESNL